MPKLYPAQKILKVLQKNGFVIISQKGSHIKLSKKTGGRNFIAIVPNHKEIAFGTFNSILKQAGMTKAEFEKLL